jgi:hypothetical protein
MRLEPQMMHHDMLCLTAPKTTRKQWRGTNGTSKALSSLSDFFSSLLMVSGSIAMEGSCSSPRQGAPRAGADLQAQQTSSKASFDVAGRLSAWDHTKE